MKHKFFQISANLTSSVKATSQHIPPSLIRGPTPSKSRAQYPPNNITTLTNRNTDLELTTNNRTSTNSTSFPEYHKPKPNRNPFSFNKPTVNDGRQSSSQDSGVHMDSNDKPSTIVPPLSTIRPPPSTRVPLPKIPSSTQSKPVTKRETEYKKSASGARKLFDNGISEGVVKRKQWDDKKEQGLFNRSKEDLLKTNKTKVQPSVVDKEMPRSLQGISKGEVAQFYLSTSRYSPLTCGKRSGGGENRRVGFGSSAPRFSDSPFKQNNQSNLHGQRPQESKGFPPLHKQDSSTFMESNQRKPLPSWLRPHPSG